jgi:glycosyltransferase involved in cell wall biosynthesis
MRFRNQRIAVAKQSPNDAVILSNPLISVVIPTRNRPALLLRAVRSALAQTLGEIEVIVVIDSEDGCGSADLVARLSDERLRCIVLQKQAGGSEARNIGIRTARAAWIALLDDDDEWLPEKLETQMTAVRKYTGQRQLVVTCQHIHRAEGAADVVRPRRLPRLGEAPCAFMFDYLCYFQTSTFLCPKELMLKIPFTKDLSFFQDIDWFLRALHGKDAQLIVVPQPLSIYYAPDARPTITSSVRWKARLEWGRANRHLMSKRSYSKFVVGSCVGSAVQDRAGLRGFGRLLYECAIVGSPTPGLILLLLGTYLLRPNLRKKLRDRLLLRRANVALTPAQKPQAKVA